MSSRTICWFSCGDASAVATKIMLKENPLSMPVRIYLSTEHLDNDRFEADCAQWFGVPITRIQSSEYSDTWDVWEKRRYIAGIQGAPCTTELKKAVRQDFQQAGDVHVFGFTRESREQERAKRMVEGNPELALRFPLIESGLTKNDCHALVRAAGIELPVMYRLGFTNNNCIGCPKGGAGYWNAIRKHFPATFTRMAELSRRLGARLVKEKGVRVFLDELSPNAGIEPGDLEIECSPMCGMMQEALNG